MEIFDIVFEAGGAKGIAFIGALEVLLRSGHVPRRLIGASAGAVTATCLAAGYTPGEMLEAASERREDRPTFLSFLHSPSIEDFPAELRAESDLGKAIKTGLESAVKSDPVEKSLKKLPAGQAIVRSLLVELNKPLLDALMANRYFLQLFALSEMGGLYRDTKFLEWLQEQLRKKNVAPSATLAQFHQKTGRDLTLAVTDTTDKELLLLNHRTAPECPVVMAVRMSMSIPFVWPDVEWRKEWGRYCKRPKAGNFVVDGSVLSGFPLRYLVDGANKGVQEIMGAPSSVKARTLGLLLDQTKPLPMSQSAPNEPSKLLQRVNRLVDTMTGTGDQEMINQYPDEICRIGAKGVRVLEFDMTEERFDAVVNSGRCAMTEWLQKRKLVVK
jgi:NTE family protein